MKTETIYVDSSKHCHRIGNETMTAVETNFFVGKCDELVEGFCYDNSKGYAAYYPWKPYSELDAAQREYERQKLADAENALAIMWGGVTV